MASQAIGKIPVMAKKNSYMALSAERFTVAADILGGTEAGL
jgi:hypothetical protein